MKLTEEMKGLLALHDEHSCRLIYTKYKTLVGFIICGRTKVTEKEVEEITKIVFCKVFQDIQNYGIGADLSPWIARIAYRVCNEYKNDKEKLLMEPLDESLLPTDKTPYGIPDFLHSDMYCYLDAKERELVFLHIIHGLSYRELSSIFHMEVREAKAKMKEIELKLEDFIKRGAK